MKNRKEKILDILFDLVLVLGFSLIVAGVFNFLNAEQNLSARVFIAAVSVFGGAVAFCTAYSLKKEINERICARTKVKQALSQNYSTQVYYNFSSKCDDCKMLCDIVSNSNVRFFAILDENEDIQITATCGEEQVYERKIFNPVYFLHYFRFIKEDAES